MAEKIDYELTEAKAAVLDAATGRIGAKAADRIAEAISQRP